MHEVLVSLPFILAQKATLMKTIGKSRYTIVYSGHDQLGPRFPSFMYAIGGATFPPEAAQLQYTCCLFA